MNSNTRLVVTAMLTLAVGGLILVGGLHFSLAHRVSVVEETVIGLTKDQIRNMERFEAIENALHAKQQDISEGLARPVDSGKME